MGKIRLNLPVSSNKYDLSILFFILQLSKSLCNVFFRKEAAKSCASPSGNKFAILQLEFQQQTLYFYYTSIIKKLYHISVTFI